MAQKPTVSKTRKAQSRARVGTWIWVALGVIVLLAAGTFIWLAQAKPAFQLIQGDRDLLILIRNDREGFYRVQYEGRRPVDLRSLKVMLAADPILHMDVQQVALQYGEQEIILERDGSLPPGEQIFLEPGETFDVLVTFHGQSIGSNYLYGFRIVYSIDDREEMYEVEMNFDYALIVR